MKYENIKEAIFLKRPNRFIAYGEIEGKEEVIHVKNTGRCKELLVPGAKIYVQYCNHSNRKTKWDLIGVEKKTENRNRLINMDSQAPNAAVKEWLESFSGLQVFPEKKHGDSRFDFYVEGPEKKAFIEVKGVTLEKDGVVLFPDAPSIRAVKHVHGLMEAIQEGYEAYVFFVVQMENVKYFIPNAETHPEFAQALKDAKAAGVHIVAYDCKITEDNMKINQPVEVRL